MSYTYHVHYTGYFSNNTRQAQQSRTVTVTRSQPVEYADDLDQLRAGLCQDSGAERVLIDCLIPLKGQVRPTAPADWPWHDEQPEPAGAPWRSAADYPGYQDNFRAEAAALFNAGLAAGISWQRGQQALATVAAMASAPAPRYCPDLQAEGARYNRLMLAHAERIRDYDGDHRSARVAVEGIADLAAFLDRGLVPEAAAHYVHMLASELGKVGLIPQGPVL